MAKQKKIYKKTATTEAMKSIRKPAMPRSKVINPKKKYDRKDKSWKDEKQLKIMLDIFCDCDRVALTNEERL